MRILVGIEHPKRVHFWKNTIDSLERDGHEIKIAARVKDISLYLLDAYGYEYEIYGRNYKGLPKKAYGLIESDFKLLRIARKFKPDIFVGKGSTYLGQVSKILRKPYICFSDTDHAKHSNWLTYPFADVICTPSCFKKKIFGNPNKHIMYNGYEELAYLHPNYFKPDPSVLDELGLDKRDKIIIVRFVSWGATHDFGQQGIKNKKKVVKELEEFGKVFITSEKPLNKEFEKYRLTIAPEKIHHLMYYATMYLGDGGAMASEAAVLGTPAVFVSTIVSGYLYDEEKYGLVHVFTDPNIGEEKAMK